MRILGILEFRPCLLIALALLLPIPRIAHCKPLDLSLLDSQKQHQLREKFGPRATFQRVSVPTVSAEEFVVPLTIDNRELHFALQKHSVRAPQFTVVEANEGLVSEFHVPQSGSYRGAAQEDESIEAAIHVGDTRRLRGVIVSGTQKHFVESVGENLLASFDGDIDVAVYENSDEQGMPSCPLEGDALEPTVTSRSSFATSGGGVGGGGASSLTSGGFVLRIGALVDNCFRTAAGGTAAVLDDVESLYNAMSFIYERDAQIQIELAVVVVELSNTVPCTQAVDGSQTLYAFGAQWPVQYPNLAPLAQNMQLLTGRPFSDVPAILGMAHFNGICNGNAYSVNHMTSIYSMGFSRRVELMSHELGHNWSAQHCNGQPDCGIMYAGLGGGALSYLGFGASARASITNYASTLSCLGTNPPGLSLPIAESFPRPTWPIPYTPWHPTWTHAMNVAAFIDTRSHISHNYSAYFSNVNSASQVSEVSAELRTNYIDTRGLDMAYVTFEAKFPSTNASPELEARYLDPSGVWRMGTLVDGLPTLPGVFRQYSFLVPQQDLQTERFRVSFRAPTRASNPLMYIDNVEITGHSGLRSIKPRGSILAPLDDIDGDGFDDYMKSDPRGPSASHSGEVWFVSGKLNQERTYLVGPHGGAEFGASIRSAGDINHDGVADVIVGAPHYGGSPVPGGPGMVRVLSGRDLALGNPYPYVLLQKVGAGLDALGTAVDGGYDIDRDGTPDIVAGAPGGAGGGYIRAWSGATGVELFTLYGPAASAKYGRSLQFIGPIDSAGFPAIIAGVHVEQSAAAPGRAVILSRLVGASQYTAATAFLGGAPSPTFMFDGFGWSVADAGDLDGDGYHDVLVGAPLGGTYCLPIAPSICFPRPGRAFVYSSATGQELFALDGLRIGDSFGSALSSAGDVDADGIPDIVVGAPADNVNGADSGSVHLFSGYGKRMVLKSGYGGDRLGASVAGQIDTTGDGRDDIVVTAARSCSSAFCQGEVRELSAFPFSGIPIQGYGGGIRDIRRERPILGITGRKFSSGYRVTYRVTNATPLSPVYVLTGFQVLNQPVFPNSRPLQYAEPVHVMSGITDAQGSYEFDFALPTISTPVRLYHQAVEVDSSINRNRMGLRGSGIQSALYTP